MEGYAQAYYMADNYPIEKPRKIYGICIECGKPIYAGNDGFYGDDCVEFPDGPMHYGCALAWCKENKREAR